MVSSMNNYVYYTKNQTQHILLYYHSENGCERNFSRNVHPHYMCNFLHTDHKVPGWCYTQSTALSHLPHTPSQRFFTLKSVTACSRTMEGQKFTHTKKKKKKALTSFSCKLFQFIIGSFYHRRSFFFFPMISALGDFTITVLFLGLVSTIIFLAFRQ